MNQNWTKHRRLIKNLNLTNRPCWIALRVVDALNAWVVADAAGGVPELLHPVVQALGVVFILGINLHGVLRGTVHLQLDVGLVQNLLHLGLTLLDDVYLL